MPESTTNGPEGAAFIAVKRCCEAWNRALEAAKAQKLDNFDSRQAANAAYLAAMPFLCGEDNIRGFIACIAQGMILEVFYDKLGTQLVYVAHTALRALPREHRPVGRPRKSSNPPQPDPESESDSGTPASQVQNNPAPSHLTQSNQTQTNQTQTNLSSPPSTPVSRTSSRTRINRKLITPTPIYLPKSGDLAPSPVQNAETEHLVIAPVAARQPKAMPRRMSAP